jgi:hypothetical protein
MHHWASMLTLVPAFVSSARSTMLAAPWIVLSAVVAGSCAYRFDFPPGRCDRGQSCPSGQYCAYPDKLCGNGLLGRCESIDDACKALTGPGREEANASVYYCGCNGQTVPTTDGCQLLRNNADLSLDPGSCAPNSDRFRCGYLLCKKPGQVCSESIATDGTTGYQCDAIDPTDCSDNTDPQCVCDRYASTFSNSTETCTCFKTAEGGLVRRCVASPGDAGTDGQNLDQACTSSGGTVETIQCCKSVDAFANMCRPDITCNCTAGNSHEVLTCNCGSLGCWIGIGCVLSL